MSDKFKQKVQSMTADEIIMAMVNGLKAEHVKVNMNTYGEVRPNGKPTCYGCAATNAIAEISGIKFTPENIYRPTEALKTDRYFLWDFEMAINHLRRGRVDDYNSFARINDFATITPTDEELPELTTDNYRDNLEPYIRLAEAQKR